MKIITYYKAAAGHFVLSNVVNQERLSFKDFERIKGGGLAALPPDHQSPPDGFGIWKDRMGEVMCIRDEAT